MISNNNNDLTRPVVNSAGTNKKETPESAHSLGIAALSTGGALGKAHLRENESPRAPTIVNLEKYGEKLSTKASRVSRIVGDFFGGWLAKIFTDTGIKFLKAALALLYRAVQENSGLKVLGFVVAGVIGLSILALSVPFWILSAMPYLAAWALEPSLEKFAQENGINSEQFQKCMQLLKEGSNTAISESELRNMMQGKNLGDKDVQLAAAILNGIKDVTPEYQQIALNIAAALIMPDTTERQTAEWGSVVKEWSEMSKEFVGNGKGKFVRKDISVLLRAGNQMVYRNDSTNVKELAEIFQKLQREFRKIGSKAIIMMPLTAITQ